MSIIKANPKVSVIIPTYNHATYVGQAVESVLNQTYRDLEVIVINDGSTDETWDVLYPYIKDIRYFYQRNSGESSARNRGIKKARGKYIAFLDADDLWAPERLAFQVPLIEKNPEVGLVYSESYRTAADGTILELALREHDRRHLSGNIFPYLLCWNVISTQTVLVRKECFERVGLFDETLSSGELVHEDYDMWLRVVRYYPVLFVDKPLAYSRHHGHNQSLNIGNFIKRKSRLFILKRMLEEKELVENVHSVIPLAFSNVFYSSAWECYTIGRMREAREELLHALRYTPFRWRVYRLLISTLLGQKMIDRLRPFRDRLSKFRFIEFSPPSN